MDGARDTWDIDCRVVDNHGDLGVCWRLACGLAARGRTVRLRCDAPSDLAWMAPHAVEGITVLAWDDAAPPGDVVVDAFGCPTPPPLLAAMARQARPPVWINLEHLSAEPYTSRCHGLRSPQASGPAAGLVQWFYFPGFVAESGGLLQEDALAGHRDAHDAVAWLSATLGIVATPGERRVSLYCYDNAALPAWLADLSAEPTLLLVTPGHAARQVTAILGPTLRRGRLRAAMLPYLPQAEFDRLLWSCDLNMVRGEDSLVRAIWAGQPFLWQAYPQNDGAHMAKVGALADVCIAATGGAGSDATAWRAALQAWNTTGADARRSGAGGTGAGVSGAGGTVTGGSGTGESGTGGSGQERSGTQESIAGLRAFDAAAIGPRLRRWRDALMGGSPLVDRLIAFAASRPTL